MHVNGARTVVRSATLMGFFFGLSEQKKEKADKQQTGRQVVADSGARRIYPFLGRRVPGGM